MSRQHLTATPALLAAVQTVLEYLYEDEQAHYRSCAPDERRGHVFESLRVIERWVAREPCFRADPNSRGRTMHRPYDPPDGVE
jgi:hypothetical protein